MKNGFFKTYDGTKIFYSVEGKGPPLFFCYGLVCSKLHWSYQMEYFKHHYTVIWLDYRGHHNSAAPATSEEITIENIAHDVECLMDELKLQKATFLGHSMGVNVVLELYKRAPQRVQAMILANGSARAPLETLFRTNLWQYLFPLLDGAYKKAPALTSFLWRAQGKSAITKSFVGWAGFNPNLCKRSDIEKYVDMVAGMDMTVTLQMVRDYESYDALAWLHKIHVPTLIIAGENDMVIPRQAQEIMHQLIARSEYELVRNGSHCPQMDIPELVNVVIERFLKKHDIPKISIS